MPVARVTSTSFRSLEKQINARLKEIGEDFSIRHLHQGPDGKFRFDLSVAIDTDQGSVVQRVLREVLRGLPADRIVQTKFYLPESIAMGIKKAAKEQKMSQSALVAQCLKSVLPG
ncbi:MAG: hypothetical protein FJX76_05055 [Armatimonadetes bacterium]|nr:hypothetical protein [Armatimonadota bacterium]